MSHFTQTSARVALFFVVALAAVVGRTADIAATKPADITVTHLDLPSNELKSIQISAISELVLE